MVYAVVIGAILTYLVSMIKLFYMYHIHKLPFTSLTDALNDYITALLTDLMTK